MADSEQASLLESRDPAKAALVNCTTRHYWDVIREQPRVNGLNRTGSTDVKADALELFKQLHRQLKPSCNQFQNAGFIHDEDCG